MSAILLEVCVDDAEGLAAAVRGGADRIELCSALSLGGLTPSPGLMRQAAKAPRPVHAMIRPRAGHFVFGADDIAVMEHDIEAVHEAGLAGVVLGASRGDDRLDAPLLRRLVRRASGLGLTLHRAVDVAPDIAEAVEIAVDLGFSRILTSGGSRTALAGADGLRRAHAAARGRIAVMPGGGVTADNLDELRAVITLGEVHASCSEPRPTRAGPAFDLGFEPSGLRRTSMEAVARLKAACADPSKN